MNENCSLMADNEWQLASDELGVVRTVYKGHTNGREIGMSIDVRLDGEKVTFIWYGSHDYKDGIHVDSDKNVTDIDKALILTVLKVIISGANCFKEL